MTAGELRAAIADYYAKLELANRDYADAAKRQAQYTYMWGTFIGVLVLLALLALAGLLAAAAGLSPLDEEALAVAFGCAVAGALGACASVSWRVLSYSELRVDAGASVLTLRGLGTVRPLVGAIFGVAIYFALRSGLINAGDSSFYLFAFVAFVAGFSERLVRGAGPQDGKRALRLREREQTQHDLSARRPQPPPRPAPSDAARSVGFDVHRLLDALVPAHRASPSTSPPSSASAS